MRFKKFSLIFSAAFLSISSVILFYKAGLGINFTIFNIFLGVIILVTASLLKRLNFSLILNTGLLSLLSIPFALTTSEPVSITLFLAWLYFLVLTIQTFVEENSKLPFWKYITIPFEQGALSLICPFLPLSRLKLTKFTYLSVIIRIIIGVLIAIPFLVLFLALFISADLAFKEMFSNVFSANFVIDFVKISSWLVFVFWVSFGVLYYNLFKKDKIEAKEEKIQKKSTRLFIESLTVLSLVELLFLIFNIVQITYLFGGESLIQSGDFTYSEYARRGFFELVAVAVIALFLIAALFKVKRTASNIQEYAIRGLGLLGLLELVPVTVSAFFRLYMYESEFGFTRLRVYSHLFIVFLTIIFLWFAIKFLSKLKESVFLYGIELIAVVCLIVVGVLNVDSVIAAFNIDSFKAVEASDCEIDLEYLYTLSYDAVPKLVEFFKESDGEVKVETAFYLKGKYDALLLETKREDIRKFQVRKYIARKSLEENLSDIEKFSTQFENKIISKYQNSNITGRGDYNYWEYNPCPNGPGIGYINTNSEEVYYSSVGIFKFDRPKEKILNYNASNCLDIEDGKYFLVLSDYDFLGTSSREVFIIEINSKEEDLVLVSRKSMEVWD